MADKKIEDENKMRVVACIKRRKIGFCDGESCITCYIPEEIIFDILIRVPANVIYDVMRYCCRMWCKIIRNSHFISSHFKKSTTGLFIQRYTTVKSSYVVKITKCDKVEVEKLKFNIDGIALASCNGLIMMLKSNTLYVVNPVTKQQLALPTFDDKYCDLRYGFGYVDSTRAYKVVYYFGEDRGCGILTLGVDKTWRFLDMSHLTCTFYHYVLSSSISIGGFVYWGNLEVPFILRLNLESEMFQQIPLPQDYNEKSLTYFLAMGSRLSFMSIINPLISEVWLLMDPEIGKWIRLPDVNFEFKRRSGLYTWLRPVGWLKNGELLVLHLWPFPLGNWMVYNVKTGETQSFELDRCEITCIDDIRAHHHVNSLLPLP